MAKKRTYLVLDIETVPDQTLWHRPEVPHGHQAPFPPNWAHQVIVVGCMWLDEDFRMRRLGVIGEATNEREILEDFSRFVERNRPSLVTFNGRTFDLPVIALRSLRHEISLPWYYQERGLRHRYSADGHIDLCDWLADHGAAKSASLDALAKLIGLPGKVGVDGSQVEGLYRAGRLADIQTYCLADVAQTAFLFLRFQLLTGALGREAYHGAVRALIDDLRADNRLPALVDAIDAGTAAQAAA